MSTRNTQLPLDTLVNLQSVYPKKGKAEAPTWAIEGFMRLRALTIDSLKGVFTKQELTALAARQNGLMVQQWHMGNKEVYVAGLEEFDRLDVGLHYYGADLDVVKNKLSKLTSCQLFFLEDEIARFWVSQTDLEKFLDEYVPSH